MGSSLVEVIRSASLGSLSVSREMAEEIAKKIESHQLEMSPSSLSEEETAELRSWAERAAVRPKTDKSRWVAQMVLRILRENFNLRKRNGK